LYGEPNEYDPGDGKNEKAQTREDGPDPVEEGETQEKQTPKGGNEQAEKEQKAGDEPDQKGSQEKEPGRTPTPQEGPPKTRTKKKCEEKEGE
jgi:hypothetical protein